MRASTWLQRSLRRRWPVLVALLLAAGSAWATDWLEVAPDNGIFSAHADRASIRRGPATVRMFGLYDMTHGDFTPNGRPYRSTLVEREYDCQAKRVRMLGWSDHAGPHGQGAVVSARREARRWEDIVEGSVDAAYLRVACAAI